MLLEKEDAAWGLDLLTAQISLIFSLGAVPDEVTCLPQSDRRSIPAAEGTLQSHFWARSRP